MSAAPLRFDSLSGWLRHVETARRELPAGHTLYFRGQHHDWPLLPGIARADRQSLLARESRLLQDFRRQAPVSLDHAPKTLKRWQALDWLALGQHYGLPTRLLDWTLSPEVALWMALHDFASGRLRHQPDQQPVLWLLRVDRQVSHASAKLFREPLAVRQTWFLPHPLDHIARVRAQQGSFTLFYQPAGGFVPLEKQKRFADRLTAFHPEAASLPQLSEELAQAGFDHARLSPPQLEALTKQLQKTPLP
ncbi:FRG domain-containing protein [uncultured Aquitalea sp.]|uniref:FRG domain-containing protein n=1 Tax=uncultured Aquitalea sp. TaxID=540272 RepID=UPI0025D79CAE|nr:FRG domain-containing protein [uncultured Aquitalea sp.]